MISTDYKTKALNKSCVVKFRIFAKIIALLIPYNFYLCIILLLQKQNKIQNLIATLVCV